MDRPEISCPYVAGNSIPMQLKTPDGVKEVEARIIRVFGPFTLSCAMVVRVDCPDAALDGNEDMVLKVFDRRFSTQARDDEKMPPWSLEIEKAYNEFRQSELGLKFVAALDDCMEDPPRDQAAELWNSSHDEAYTQWYLKDLFERELKTYETLKDWQGNTIPRLIATVHVPGGDPAMPQPDMEGFSGVLLQFIPGFFLTDLADNAPPELWQPICDHAIRIINLMGDRGILNEDVQTRSFIVSIDGEDGPEDSSEDSPGIDPEDSPEDHPEDRPEDRPGDSPEDLPEDRPEDRPDGRLGFKIFMIDFAYCSLREDYDDEQEWSESKGVEEEEERIGLPMESKLKGGFVYNRSFRWKKPASYYEGGEGFE